MVGIGRNCPKESMVCLITRIEQGNIIVGTKAPAGDPVKNSLKSPTVGSREVPPPTGRGI